MDPINILVAVNLIASMGANLSGAKRGMKQTVVKYLHKPKTYLQKLPPNVAAVVLILQILGILNVGVLEQTEPDRFLTIRLIGLGTFVLFSWLQVAAYKKLGKNYSQEIAIINGHGLVTTGIYKAIRHPQYACQALSDIGAGLALMSYLVVPVAVLIELPLFILRAAREEKMMINHFGNEYEDYKKKSGFIIPFIG